MATNITFFIGNGFDIQMGLDTRWSDFYEDYLKNRDEDNKEINIFKNIILKDKGKDGKWKNWSDFELGLGQESNEFYDIPEIFQECHDDFVVKFEKYLIKECEKIDWDKINNDMINKFDNSIKVYWTKIKSLEQSKIVIRDNQFNFGFLQFNYTDIFDKLIVKSSVFNKNTCINLHIHGKIGSHITIGVDNEKQIANKIIREDKDVNATFIKQNFLSEIQSINVNTPIDARKAINVIQSSNRICTFGTSIGDTDKYWWKLVGSWLKTGENKLVIFDICGKKYVGNESPRQLRRTNNVIRNKKQEIIDRFARLAEWSDEEKKLYENKIIVELNSTMFDFKLPKKVDDKEKETEDKKQFAASTSATN
jgi:hypothetical protein